MSLTGAGVFSLVNYLGVQNIDVLKEVHCKIPVTRFYKKYNIRYKEALVNPAWFFGVSDARLQFR